MRSLIVLSLVLLTLQPVAAGGCVPTTSSPEVDTGFTPAGRFYVDDGFCEMCGYVWIYEEANGIDGLQRADEVVDDTCNGMIEGDRLVF